MSDENAAATSPKFNILRVYVKDASFESPSAPRLFVSGVIWRPKVDIEINTSASALGKDVYEVVMTGTLRAKDESGGTSYIVEVQQAGLFEIAGVSEQQLGMVLEVNCPTILFPYLRVAIDNQLGHGSFPPAGLVPINFEARYAAAQQRRAEQSRGSESKAKQKQKH